MEYIYIVKSRLT